MWGRIQSTMTITQCYLRLELASSRSVPTHHYTINIHQKQYIDIVTYIHEPFTLNYEYVLVNMKLKAELLRFSGQQNKNVTYAVYYQQHLLTKRIFYTGL